MAVQPAHCGRISGYPIRLQLFCCNQRKLHYNDFLTHTLCVHVRRIFEEVDEWLFYLPTADGSLDSQADYNCYVKKNGKCFTGNDGINKFATSYFSDVTSSRAKKGKYQCEKILVKSTGNDALDRVNSRLSFNDITIMRNPDLLKNENTTNFLGGLFHIFETEAMGVLSQDCKVASQKCINAVRKDNEKKKSKRVDDTFFDSRKCLLMAIVTGNIDCKFWLSDGLINDIQAVKAFHGKKLRSAVRQKSASWAVNQGMMPDDALPHSKEFGQVCIWKASFLWSGRMLLIFHATGCVHHLGSIHDHPIRYQPKGSLSCLGQARETGFL